jgi:hypothetical protein
LLLAPLEGRGDDAWFRAPAGQWCAGQIIDHLATAMENSARGFASRHDKPSMIRRRRTLGQLAACGLVLGLGWFPVRRTAPETTLPGSRPERTATEARLRAAVGAYLAMEDQLLPQRANNLFLKHPALGDLTIKEFELFHLRHAEHHLRQMLDRIAG